MGLSRAFGGVGDDGGVHRENPENRENRLKGRRRPYRHRCVCAWETERIHHVHDVCWLVCERSLGIKERN